MNPASLSSLRQLNRFTFLASLTTLLTIPLSTFGQTNTVFTDPVGYYSVTLLSNSDTRVSIPFTRSPAFHGAVQSVNGNVVTVTGAPNWTVNQFVYNAGTQSNTYYAFLASGTKEGQFFTITNNATSSVSLLLDVGDLTGVTAGDRMQIIPYWTLATAFPGGSGVNATTNLAQRLTEVFFFDPSLVGINPSASSTYFLYQSHWRRIGDPLSSFKDDDVLVPDQYLIVRQNLNAPTTVFTPPGLVPLKKLSVALYTHNNTRQDNTIALQRPVPVSLSQSGLISSGAFETTTSLANIRDQLLVFDNAVIGKNKSASKTYFHYNGGWRRFGVPITTDVGADEVFLPGTGLIVRKGTNATSATSFWINTATY